MTIGIVGRKAGMTRIFTENGAAVPVTVISVEPNRVTQVKTVETDGYRALQVTTGSRRATRVTKPMAGHYAKAQTEAGRGLWEFRLEDGEGGDIGVGSELGVDLFHARQLAITPRAGFHRSESDPGPGGQGQENVRPHG